MARISYPKNLKGMKSFWRIFITYCEMPHMVTQRLAIAGAMKHAEHEGFNVLKMNANSAKYQLYSEHIKT